MISAHGFTATYEQLAEPTMLANRRSMRSHSFSSISASTLLQDRATQLNVGNERRRSDS
jgi:hypothetical protein